MKYFVQILFTSILILFLIAACSNKETELPPIDKEKMQAILQDMHFAQAATQFRMIKKDSLLKAHKSGYYAQIFEIHQTTEVEYLTSYNYYLDNPEILHEIYEEMVKELTKMEAESKPLEN